MLRGLPPPPIDSRLKRIMSPGELGGFSLQGLFLMIAESPIKDLTTKAKNKINHSTLIMTSERHHIFSWGRMKESLFSLSYLVPSCFFLEGKKNRPNIWRIQTSQQTTLLKIVEILTQNSCSLLHIQRCVWVGSVVLVPYYSLEFGRSIKSLLRLLEILTPWIYHYFLFEANYNSKHKRSVMSLSV